MSLAFVTSRKFVASNIIGATNLKQLKENIDSINTCISPELMIRLDELAQIYRLPCP